MSTIGYNLDIQKSFARDASNNISILNRNSHFPKPVIHTAQQSTNTNPTGFVIKHYTRIYK